MSRPNMRLSLERVGVEIVEVSDVAEAAGDGVAGEVEEGGEVGNARSCQRGSRSK